MTILADGRVAMCCFDSEAEYSVGDVTTQSLYEVWHSEDFDRLREALYHRDFEQVKICGKCDYVNHPGWLTPLLRIRPKVQDSFPGAVEAAGRVYKRWLNR
jgi:hypothetical protein